MKIVLCLRSETVFEYVSKAIQLSSKLYGFRLPDQNVGTVQLLEDFINFYEADFYIIDRLLTDSNDFIRLVNENGINHIVIDDYKEVVKHLEGEYGKEEIKENFKILENEKPKVEVKTKIIEKEIYVSKYKAIPHKLILVGSLYPSSGCTTIATNLARMVAERGIDVSYIENPLATPRMYDYLQIGYRTDEYHDFAQEIKSNSIPDTEPYSYKGVKWIVNNPVYNRPESFDFDELNLLYQLSFSTVTIIDVSNYFHDPNFLKLSKIADEVFLVLEPDPIKNENNLYSSDLKGNVIKHFDIHNIDYKIILTRADIKGIDHKVLKEMLPKRTFLEIPYIPYEVLIRNLYNTTLFYDDSKNEGKEFLERYLKDLIYLTLPKEIVTLFKQKSIFGTLFNRR